MSPCQPPTSRVLVVDGDASERLSTASSLEFAGMRVDQAGDAEDALELLARDRFDVVVTELDLRSMSGIGLMHEIRTGSDVPVVILSRCVDSMFAVLAFEAGAADYCPKPLSERELVLRVRRAMGLAPARPGAGVPSTVLCAADGLVIDPAARLVAVDGAQVDLTAKEFDLLVVLASSPGKVFTRGDLLEEVWGTKPDWQSVDTVTEHVYRLRQKLDVNHTEPNWIQTVRGAGYRFAPATPAVAAAPAAPAALGHLAG